MSAPPRVPAKLLFTRAIGQTFQITALVLAQLQKQSHLDDRQLLIAALRGVTSLYKKENH